ncbi:MAG: MarR family transcriptional regulator [Pseudoruegeria sp.]
MNLDTYFPYQLASTAEAFSQKLVDVYGRSYGLSREEWRLFLLLADAKSLTSLELSQRTTLDKVQVSRAAKKLDDKNLITRSISETDKRLRVYSCTDAGVKLFAELFPKVELQAQSVLAHMSTSERNDLDRGLAALKRAISLHFSEQA